jgi:tetratricopeptide (TPR) repeat protein
MSIPSRIVASLRENLRKALKARNLAESRNLLTRLRKEEPGSAETRGFELEMLSIGGDWKGAEALADQLCRDFPQSSRIHFLAGQVSYHLKNYQMANLRFRESHALHPHALSQLWRGKALTQLGQFDEAEALLESVRLQYPSALRDLGWLYERRGEIDRAIEAYQTILQDDPEDEYLRQQVIRLKARAAEPHEVFQEVQNLQEFGEEVPESLFQEYIQKLFATGNVVQARKEVLEKMKQWTPKAQLQMAWICYKALAFDLACELFLLALPSHSHDFKMLAALESAADRSLRIDLAIGAYRQMAERDPHFFGRIKALERRRRRPG